MGRQIAEAGRENAHPRAPLTGAGMPGESAGLRSERVLLLAAERDAAAVVERAAADGHACEVCDDLEQALAALPQGAGAFVVSEQALDARATAALAAWLTDQEPWSDLPVLLLTEAAAGPTRTELLALMAGANVTLLPPPLAGLTLSSAIASALRARRRQYELRGLIRDLERALGFAETLSAILSHDLRSPLGSAQVSAELILRSSKDERALRAASRILSATDRMRRLVDDLLDYAWVRRGRGLPMHGRAADAGEICRAVAAEVETSEPAARVALHLDGDLEGYWDPDRLAQLASNLITNAVRYGSEVSPVEVRLDGREPSLVRLSVHNAGAMPETALPVLFEPFANVPSDSALVAPRDTRTGLGLGLHIAREIARAHGGEIGVSSAGSSGTTFTVTLPRRLPSSG